MARKPNYNLERSERNRAKEARKLEKLKLQQERAVQRKEAGQESPAGEADGQPLDD